MAKRWRRLLGLAAVGVLLNVPTTQAQDNFGRGDGHSGAFVAPPGVSSVNIYNYAIMPASPGDTEVTVNNAAGFEAGDLVMMWRAFGYFPAPAPGDQSPIDLSSSDVGRYELARVSAILDNVFVLSAPLQHNVSPGLTQIIRVPEFTTVVVPSGSTLVPGQKWDGTSGGIVAFLATGTVTVDGEISASGYGFRGGVVDTAAECGAGRTGESISNSTYQGIRDLGNIANGGGGGFCGIGGGGGGNGGGGGDAFGWFSVFGGATLTYSLQDHLSLGGGGGASTGEGGRSGGGSGGGVVFMRAESLQGIGDINANGTSPDDPSGAGGGGAGGNVYLRLDGPTSICAGLGARGGRGGEEVGPAMVVGGGGGGGGHILLQSSNRCSEIDVSGGDHGFSSNSRVVAGTPGVIEQINPGNLPPEVNAGPDQHHAICLNCLVPITLPGIISDSENDPLQIEWRERGSGQLWATTSSATLYLGAGTYTVDLRVTDQIHTVIDTLVIDIAIADNSALLQQLADAQAAIANHLRTIGERDATIAERDQRIASLESELATALVTLGECRATVAGLQGDLAAADARITELLGQLSTANQTIAALREELRTAGSLDDVRALLAELQQMLRTEMSDTSFTIPGATPLEQLRNVITAINGLNHGQKLALYKNLGGKKTK